MNMKKIENQTYKMNGNYIDNIEKELKKDGFDFEEDTIVFEDFFAITSSDDEIKIMKNADIVYVDDKRYYAVVKDELGDYAVCSLKNYSSSKIKEFIESNLNSDANVDDEIVVEFYGYNGDCCIAGFMELSDADDEKPLQFYDNNGFEIGYNYPTNPYTEYEDKKYYSFESLKEAMQNDDMIIQYLVDYADESACIQRENYELRINESDIGKISVSL